MTVLSSVKNRKTSSIGRVRVGLDGDRPDQVAPLRVELVEGGTDSGSVAIGVSPSSRSSSKTPRGLIPRRRISGPGARVIR